MKIAMVAMLVVGLSILPTAISQAEGFSWPNLNPFRSQQDRQVQPARYTPSPAAGSPAEQSRGFQMPSLPRFTKPAPRHPNQPSTLTRINNSTKEFFSKAASAITPSRKTPDVRQQRSNNQGGLFSGWFSSEPEPPPRAATPSDWISKPKPY